MLGKRKTMLSRSGGRGEGWSTHRRIVVAVAYARGSRARRVVDGYAGFIKAEAEAEHATRAGGGAVAVTRCVQERGRDRSGDVADDGVDGAMGGEVCEERVQVDDVREDDSGWGQVGDDVLQGVAAVHAAAGWATARMWWPKWSNSWTVVSEGAREQKGWVAAVGAVEVGRRM